MVLALSHQLVFIFLDPWFSVFQELTKLRITDIQGIEKPEPKVDPKRKRAAVKTEEKVAVAA